MAECIHGQEHPCPKCRRGPHALECNLNFRDRIRNACNCQVMLDYADQLERERRPIPDAARMLRQKGTTEITLRRDAFPEEE